MARSLPACTPCKRHVALPRVGGATVWLTPPPNDWPRPGRMHSARHSEPLSTTLLCSRSSPTRRCPHGASCRLGKPTRGSQRTDTPGSCAQSRRRASSNQTSRFLARRLPRRPLRTFGSCGRRCSSSALRWDGQRAPQCTTFRSSPWLRGGLSAPSRGVRGGRGRGPQAAHATELERTQAGLRGTMRRRASAGLHKRQRTEVYRLGVYRSGGLRAPAVRDTDRRLSASGTF